MSAHYYEKNFNIFLPNNLELVFGSVIYYRPYSLFYCEISAIFSIVIFFYLRKSFLLLFDNKKIFLNFSFSTFSILPWKHVCLKDRHSFIVS